MSEHLLRLIPADPLYVPSVDQVDLAARRFNEFVPDADEVEVDLPGRVVFYDAGGNAESIACPCCGADLPEQWWSDRMDEAFDRKARTFSELGVALPCCGARCSLNDLSYDWPAGFASFALIARNAGIGGALPEQQLAALEAVLGCRLRQVLTRY